MSNLKNVRAELEKMKKEMAAKEAELKREEARPVIELINSELLRGCGRFLGPELSNSKTASILHRTQTP